MFPTWPERKGCRKRRWSKTWSPRGTPYFTPKSLRGWWPGWDGRSWKAEFGCPITLLALMKGMGAEH